MGLLDIDILNNSPFKNKKRVLYKTLNVLYTDIPSPKPATWNNKKLGFYEKLNFLDSDTLLEQFYMEEEEQVSLVKVQDLYKKLDRLDIDIPSPKMATWKDKKPDLYNKLDLLDNDIPSPKTTTWKNKKPDLYKKLDLRDIHIPSLKMATWKDKKSVLCKKLNVIYIDILPTNTPT